MILRGEGVSPGVFEGPARVLDAQAGLEAALAVSRRGPGDAELERLRAATARARAQLERIRRQLARQGRKDDAEIFAAHMAMMQDPVLLRRIESAIDAGKLSAEAGVASAVRELHGEVQSSEHPMVRDKAADVLDIGHRLLRCLDPAVESGLPHADASVIVAVTLTPSELVRLYHQGPCAVLTESAGRRSHVAILARGLGIPLVTGIGSPVERIPDGSRVLVDGDDGIAVIDARGPERAVERRIRERLRVAALPGPKPGEPVTRDGVAIRVALNISDPAEAEAVPRLGAAGVGLFRTEFLYMDRRGWPDERESLEAYERVAQCVGSGDLQIRLADFGADKRPEYADIPVGRNPSLGVRGVRLLLQREDILAPQVRALAQLARRRPVTVLIPMLDGLDTLALISQRLREICRAGGRGSPGGLPFALGAMIEVPAAALAIRAIAREVDAISIGLNDLTQYLLAADREDELVSSYHDALQPAVLTVVQQVVDGAAAWNRPLTVCGELAGDPALTAVLLALGVRRLSVSRSDYPRLVATVRGLELSELSSARQELLSLSSGAEVRRFLAGRTPAVDVAPPTAG